MLSLDYAFSEDEARNFDERVKKGLKDYEISFIKQILADAVEEKELKKFAPWFARLKNTLITDMEEWENTSPKTIKYFLCTIK